MSREVNLKDVLERVDRSGLKDREKALDDLRHLLRKTSKLEALRDESIHGIYDVLFKVALKDQSTYLKASTHATQSAAASRLSSCGSSLRLAVEALVTLIKPKTIKAVIDHILYLLRVSSGGFCEPLALDYARSLRAIVEYHPHAEHLSGEDREQLLKFCVDSITAGRSETVDEDSDGDAGARSSVRSVNGLSYRSSRSRLGNSNPSHGDRALSKQVTKELVACLSSLTATSSSALAGQSELVISCLMQCLQDNALSDTALVDAFTAINNTLARTRVENVALTRKQTIPLVRLIKQFWSSTLLSQLLVTWLYILPYVFSRLEEGNSDHLRHEVDSVIQIMERQYIARHERDQLQVDNLDIHLSKLTRERSLHTGAFWLRCALARPESSSRLDTSNRLENAWITIFVLASLASALSTNDDTGDESSVDDDGQENPIRSRKRLRLSDRLDDLLASCGSGLPSARLCSMQVLTLLTQQREFTETFCVKAINTLSLICGDEDSNLASWAFLALTGLASQDTSAQNVLSSHWNSVWQLAIRGMMNTLTCRAACHLLSAIMRLRLIPQSMTSELMLTLSTSMDINGPSVLTDSSTQFILLLCRLSRKINPTITSALRDSTLRWLFRHFMPSRVTDRSYASQHGLFDAADIIDLVTWSLDQPRSSHGRSAQYPTWDAVGRAWINCLEQQDLVHYLLLRPDNTTSRRVKPTVDDFNVESHHATHSSAASSVLNFFSTELANARKVWDQVVQEPDRNVNLDMFCSLLISLCISTSIAFALEFQDQRRQARFQEDVRGFLQTLSNFIASDDCNQEKVDAALRIVSPFCTGLVGTGSLLKPSTTETLLCRTLSQALSARNSKDDNAKDTGYDMMELDDMFESQASRRGNNGNTLQDFRDQQTAIFSPHALRCNVTIYANIVEIMDETVFLDANTKFSSSRVADYLLGNPPLAIFCSGSMVASLLSSLSDPLTVDDSYRILEHCTTIILDPYEHNRSEAALGCLLDIVSSLLPSWTNPQNVDLFELGSELYGYFVGKALRGGLLSPKNQKRVSNLVLQLCHIDTDYGRADGNPSARTSLFTLVQLGSVSVQYDLAPRISSVFGLFVLSAHYKIFDDFLESLPDDSLWLEGMAMRLLFLSELASSWHSLLRQCTYYIFETAGKVKASAKHASRCVSEVAKKLGFDSSQRLFALFAPQLLHTWLESHSIAGLPFTTFQFDSLQHLFQQNESEITAQLLMRGNEDGLQLVSKSLGCTVAALARQSFAKCLAYCISWDVGKSSSASAETTESRLRKLVGGKEELSVLATTQFAVIIGHFLLTAQPDDDPQKWLDKHPQYEFVRKSMVEMKSLSQAEQVLPPSQQPSFKSKYLFDQIARLCKRTQHDPLRPWDASSISLSARMLLDSIDPALGPLQTALVIRRLRLMVCMAGEVACTGLCLEMLVHALTPFLGDARCADDAIGLVQYLFDRGQAYLQIHSPLAHGSTMLAILQMRTYASKGQDGTTQESQHLAIVQKMQSAQTWFVKFAEQCRPAADSVHSDRYRRLSDALAKIHLPGNCRKGSSESELLLLLLDRRSSQSETFLLSSDRNEALKLLTTEFSGPESTEEDCLGSDDDCIQYASDVLLSLDTASLDPIYTGWAAGVLGRAYAATGIPAHRTGHTSHERDIRSESLDLAGVARSQAHIANLLCDSLRSRDRFESSLADHTLRRVASSFTKEDEATAFAEMLPETLVAGIAGGTFEYQPALLGRAHQSTTKITDLGDILISASQESAEQLTRQLCVAVCESASGTAILPALAPMLRSFSHFARSAAPYILHIILDHDLRSKSILRPQLSKAANACFGPSSQSTIPQQRFWLDIILFLREQPFPGENTVADRLTWLEIDLIPAAEAAVRCKMLTQGLLLIESASQSISSGNRRASARTTVSQLSLDQAPQELMLSIYRGVEEPDSFYGVDQPASLRSVLDRLDYEEDGFKSLMFHSSQTDAQIRNSHQLVQSDAAGIIRSLSTLNMNSLTLMLLSRGVDDVNATSEDFASAARELQQWDILAPANSSTGSATTFSMLQELTRVDGRQQMQLKLQSALRDHMQRLPGDDGSYRQVHDWYGTLASLVEVREVVDCVASASLSSTWRCMAQRQSWMQMARYDNFKTILSTQHTLFSVLAQNNSMQGEMRVSLADCQETEVRSLLTVLSLSRDHGHLPQALAAATQLSELATKMQETAFNLESTIKSETASVIWELGETTGSVRMLQDALAAHSVDRQDLSTGRPGMLAQLAHQLAEARLEKPEDILAKYLKPAIQELGDRIEGEEAGKVFYEFAAFCDKQLLNPGNVEDFNRIAKLRQNKIDEVQQLEEMSKKGRKSGDASEHKHLLKKAKQWLDIDDEDYQRLKKSRDTFTQQSLLNYLLALQASDRHNISVLRFFALWLENVSDKSANSIVVKNLPKVPSWKLVRLLNQLMSRLENEQSDFQKALQDLIFRICADHPYHSLHHLYASTRKPQYKDQTATMSRVYKASEIRKELNNTLSSVAEKAELLRNWFIADNLYNGLAWESTDAYKGSKIAVKEFQSAYNVASKIPQLKVPPATISVPLRPDCNYENIPVVVKFDPTMRLMSGLSKPKKMTALASNGKHFAALFKSGNDDMRQDSIMEQVFEEASKMLQDHKTTRQRNLHVRTYKVIPLANKSGIIEFVPNSISLSDFLTPAHVRYFPSDYKASSARERIHNVKEHSTEVRLKEYKKVCDHMHPVLRHFFFERFTDPDEWFEKRTAYTRTTASVSILGYVLGLGDRHCQNIMLDEKTGEVIHIDLGVAFEAGRVLPIPELVPFRLTRDVIDGFGITKTEGVFRRCCEFTLDALRRDKDSIMTLLNVLRYDPLYQWTISPVRAKRMQDAETGQNEIMGGKAGSSNDAEAGEADRALSIVEKKLSQTLSTSAAVNELIQQAVDERNLATLFSGWAAYF